MDSARKFRGRQPKPPRELFSNCNLSRFCVWQILVSNRNKVAFSLPLCTLSLPECCSPKSSCQTVFILKVEENSSYIVDFHCLPCTFLLLITWHDPGLFVEKWCLCYRSSGCYFTRPLWGKFTLCSVQYLLVSLLITAKYFQYVLNDISNLKKKFKQQIQKQYKYNLPTTNHMLFLPS